MWKQKHCQAPDRRRNKANRPQSRLNGGLAAWLTETSPTACSSLTPAGRLRDGVWISQTASGLSNKLAASSQGWKWRYTSCEAVLFFHGQSNSQAEKRCSVWRRPADLQCTVWWVKSDGSPRPLGVWHFNLLSQQTNGQSAVASAWTEVWLQLDQKPIFCPSNLCKPHPHSTTVLSHRAQWLQPLWLASICIHSYSTLYLPLISHPPLHFSKLRCNFVNLQWDHPSALPVDCHLVSYSCRASSLLAALNDNPRTHLHHF